MMVYELLGHAIKITPNKGVAGIAPVFGTGLSSVFL
jgi:hypothetical protein